MPQNGPGPRVCRVPWCKVILELGYALAACPACLKKDKRSKKRRRDENKPLANTSEAPVTLTANPAATSSLRSPLASRTFNVEGPSAHPDSSTEEENPSFKRPKAGVQFDNLPLLLNALHTSMKDAEENDIEFSYVGEYKCHSSEVLDEKQYACDIANAIWKTTGYRFMARDYRKAKQGIHKRMWCSQAAAHAKAPKPSQNPEVKRRETIGMDRFDCAGALSIRIKPNPWADNLHLITITLGHKQGHVRYVDVKMPPEALDYIKAQMHLTPRLIASQLAETFPNLTQAQVYAAWSRLSETYWKKDDDPFVSALQLLREDVRGADLWDLQVPEGVTAIAWGCRRISNKIGAKVLEIGLDATYNTNEANLELYSVLGELDNAGFPLAYCLLSTATSISSHKRTAALTTFLQQVRKTYNIIPSFTHVDKDFAEISALGKVWPDAKTQICLWHLDRAVGDRLAKPGLKTTPYDVASARVEFGFISPSFRPTTQPDPRDNEEFGYRSDDEYRPGQKKTKQKKKAFPTSTLPPRLPLPLLSQANPNAIIIKIAVPSSQNISNPRPNSPPSDDPTDSEDSDTGDTGTRRQFCPLDLREKVRLLIEKHFCVHPSIPGYARPSEVAIRWWAVQEMYDFCVRNRLCELWAYLWGNWYRPERWTLWARSTCVEIPRLRTTMICESHWRRIKSDYLTHNHKPRIDYLTWILIKRLMPTYDRLLTERLTYTGRHRRQPAWRRAFKREWKRCAVAPITDPDDDKYNPLPYRWVCSCPAFVRNRFLVCKHLVQSVHQVPPSFFQQVSRERSCPIWRHPSLRPIAPPSPGDLASLVPSSFSTNNAGVTKDGRGIEQVGQGGGESDTDSDDEGSSVGNDEDPEQEDEEDEAERKGIQEEMKEIAELLRDLASVIDYNAQYTDPRALVLFARKTQRSTHLIKRIKKKEKLIQNHNSPHLPVFDRAHSDLMFIRTRPRKITTRA